MRVKTLTIEFDGYVHPSNTAFITIKLMKALSKGMSKVEKDYFDEHGHKLKKGNQAWFRWSEPRNKALKKHRVKEVVLDVEEK